MATETEPYRGRCLVTDELTDAVAEVKQRLGVTTALIASHLPEHLREAFWEQAVDYYLRDQMALLDAVEEAGFIAAAEMRGYDRAVANLRDHDKVRVHFGWVPAANLVNHPDAFADYLDSVREDQ